MAKERMPIVLIPPEEATPELKRLAWRCVEDALACGILVQDNCAVCNRFSTEAHHADYAYPLRVRWLCRRHHLITHRRRGQ